ncbi:MAG: sigma 54-interacting transcriptional regulator [Proteobacteria bacterium]|nr:response regulator [Desulfobulbaceae bacterium]MBU4151832.1 sigma 54-interacting transcriptional regulator [Pseudomonadota bacterium]
MPQSVILLVDDDTDLLSLLSMRLVAEGYQVHQATSAEEALARLSVVRPDLVVTDLRMSGMDGLNLFDSIRAGNPFLPVIIMTAHGSIPEAVAATQRGVFSFLTKPLSGMALLMEIKRALNLSGASQLPAVRQEESWRQDIIHQSQAMTDILAQAQLVAGGRVNILILGESGTGKELLAKAIHRASPRCHKPFIAINCGAIPETLLESELFGHVKGSFTGAVRDHHGLIRAADQGTLFLDEIGDTPLSFQVKLLRVIQERILRPVGSAESVGVDVRIISATHRPLAQMVSDGLFREDLYYRLNVVSLSLPKLAERAEDIPLLANYFLRESARSADKTIHGFAPEAMEMLIGAPWPGNIRQLYNVVEHSVALATSPIIPASLIGMTIQKNFARYPTFAEARMRFEQEYLISLLKMTEGNVTQAARIADRNRTDFYTLLQRNHIIPALFKKE